MRKKRVCLKPRIRDKRESNGSKYYRIMAST